MNEQKPEIKNLRVDIAYKEVKIDSPYIVFFKLREKDPFIMSRDGKLIVCVDPQTLNEYPESDFLKTDAARELAVQNGWLFFGSAKSEDIFLKRFSYKDFISALEGVVSNYPDSIEAKNLEQLKAESPYLSSVRLIEKNGYRIDGRIKNSQLQGLDKQKGFIGIRLSLDFDHDFFPSFRNLEARISPSSPSANYDCFNEEDITSVDMALEILSRKHPDKYILPYMKYTEDGIKIKYNQKYPYKNPNQPTSVIFPKFRASVGAIFKAINLIGEERQRYAASLAEKMKE